VAKPEIEAAVAHMKATVPMFEEGRRVYAKLICCDTDGHLKPWQVALQQSAIIAMALQKMKEDTLADLQKSSQN
jgi:hypothetical protein